MATPTTDRDSTRLCEEVGEEMVSVRAIAQVETHAQVMRTWCLGGLQRYSPLEGAETSLPNSLPYLCHGRASRCQIDRRDGVVLSIENSLTLETAKTSLSPAPTEFDMKVYHLRGNPA